MVPVREVLLPEVPAVKDRLAILLTAVLFSTGGAAIKATTLTSWQVASFRSGVAALAVWLLLPAARRWPRPRVWLVAVAYAGTMVFFVMGNKLTTAANTIFLQSTAPLYVLLLAPWLLAEPVRRRDVAFMAALAVGMGLFFVGVEAPRDTAPDPRAGDLLAAAAGVCWAFTVMGLRWLGRGDEDEDRAAGGEAPTPRQLRAQGASAVVVGNVLACVALLPWALPVAQARVVDWGLIAFLGVFQIGVAYVLLTRALRRVAAFEASLLLLVEPVLNPVWAWWIHGEVPGPWALTGGALILGATAVKTWVDARWG